MTSQNERYDLEFEPIKLRMKLDGVLHELTYPSVKQQEDFEAAYAEAVLQGGNAASQVTKEYVVKCGLPMEVIEKMQFEHFRMLLGALASPKKN